MSFDMNQITQMLNNLPYPINKNDLVQTARQYGVNDQMVNALGQMLPDRTFNSPQDLMNSIGAMGGTGGSQQQNQAAGWMGQGQQDQGDQAQAGGWMGQGQQDQGDQGQMGSF